MFWFIVKSIVSVLYEMDKIYCLKYKKKNNNNKHKSLMISTSKQHVHTEERLKVLLCGKYNKSRL